MAEGGAYELLKGEKTYRAPDFETLMRWARERRITAADMIRPAGTEEWKRAGDLPEFSQLVDPSNWWTVRMGDSAYTAPDFATIERWTREGRLNTEAVIEGPRTPPGGVLAKGLPRLAPFLRPPLQSADGSIPPRLRIDGVEYFPKDPETIRLWISEARVPPDAEISVSGGPWEPLGPSGLFERELWPEGAWGDHMPDEPSEPSSEPSRGTLGAPGQAGEAPPESAPAQQAASQKPVLHSGWRIVTLNEELVIDDPSRIPRLLRSRRIHSFDDVLHPSLPDGRCSVSRAIEILRLGRRRFPWWMLAVLVLIALGVVFVLIDPMNWGIRLPL
ncbi:hypothetical protein GX411_10345 [Candidatus Fermentibacteria bacterium]|nr:hypothetical protein [Candidatus Fermentibacteria bacterium]